MYDSNSRHIPAQHSLPTIIRNIKFVGNSSGILKRRGMEPIIKASYNLPYVVGTRYNIKFMGYGDGIMKREGFEPSGKICEPVILKVLKETPLGYIYRRNAKLVSGKKDEFLLDNAQGEQFILNIYDGGEASPLFHTILFDKQKMIHAANPLSYSVNEKSQMVLLQYAQSKMLGMFKRNTAVMSMNIKDFNYLYAEASEPTPPTLVKLSYAEPR